MNGKNAWNTTSVTRGKDSEQNSEQYFRDPRFSTMKSAPYDGTFGDPLYTYIELEVLESIGKVRKTGNRKRRCKIKSCRNR